MDTRPDIHDDHDYSEVPAAGTILVLDDEAQMLRSLDRMLSREGYQVLTASNGREGLEVLRNHNGEVDTALCDLKMGEMDGMEFVEAARSLFPDLEVIIMTGYGTIEAAVEAMRAGAYDFLPKPFIKVSCAAIPETLLEAELFGYERGAFTGAAKRKPGRFELAEGGTLFLDEIGDVPMEMQVKLLRAIQEREYERLGGTQTLKADIRVLAATHRDLQERVAEGLFREDLYYRLAVIPLEIPPLRQRRDDIPLLAAFFVEKLSEKNRSPVPAIHPDAMERLMSYDWPGNVRELENVLERAVILSKDRLIKPGDLPPHIAPRRREANVLNVPLGTPLRQIQEMVIDQTLDITDGNKEKAANLLGVAARTIYRHLKAREEEADDGDGTGTD